MHSKFRQRMPVSRALSIALATAVGCGVVVALVSPYTFGAALAAIGTTATAAIGVAAVFVSFLVTDARLIRASRRRRRTTRMANCYRTLAGVDSRSAHGSALVVTELAIQAAGRLMPRSAGRRWLGEVASFQAECDPAQWRAAMWSWVRGTPVLIMLMWVGVLARRIRGAGGRRAAGQSPGGS